MKLFSLLFGAITAFKICIPSSNGDQCLDRRGKFGDPKKGDSFRLIHMIPKNTKNSNSAILITPNQEILSVTENGMKLTKFRDKNNNGLITEAYRVKFGNSGDENIYGYNVILIDSGKSEYKISTLDGNKCFGFDNNNNLKLVDCNKENSDIITLKDIESDKGQKSKSENTIEIVQDKDTLNKENSNGSNGSGETTLTEKDKEIIAMVAVTAAKATRNEEIKDLKSEHPDQLNLNNQNNSSKYNTPNQNNSSYKNNEEERDILSDIEKLTPAEIKKLRKILEKEQNNRNSLNSSNNTQQLENTTNPQQAATQKLDNSQLFNNRESQIVPAVSNQLAPSNSNPFSQFQVLPGYNTTQQQAPAALDNQIFQQPPVAQSYNSSSQPPIPQQPPTAQSFSTPSQYLYYSSQLSPSQTSQQAPTAQSYYAMPQQATGVQNLNSQVQAQVIPNNQMMPQSQGVPNYNQMMPQSQGVPNYNQMMPQSQGVPNSNQMMPQGQVATNYNQMMPQSQGIPNNQMLSQGQGVPNPNPSLQKEIVLRWLQKLVQEPSTKDKISDFFKSLTSRNYSSALSEFIEDENPDFLKHSKKRKNKNYD